ncbi:MAG: double zinc ribbon domain-containing protein [Planctomycetia bacterium]|nr:double zinc ribbon domain-containing protein [Planctomycetia bacterium]
MLKVRLDIKSRLASAALGVRLGARQFGRGTLDLAFPPVCVACSQSLASAEGESEDGSVDYADRRALLCEDCRKAFVNYTGAVCARCGAGTSSTGPAADCTSCRSRRFRFASVVAVGRYEGELREAVLRTKKSAGTALTMSLAELLWELRGESMAAFRPDVVAAVPMHWLRRASRGVNAADTICETLARRLKVPSAPQMLLRRRNTVPQSELPATRRRFNVRRAFRVRYSYVLRGARALLVDDILTSGATASQAAAALREAGAAEVGVAVLARADHPM